MSLDGRLPSRIMADENNMLERIAELENRLEDYAKQNRTLKEQLTVWKGQAREHQRVAGRWQLMFENGNNLIKMIEVNIDPEFMELLGLQEPLDEYKELVGSILRSPTTEPENR